MQIQGITDAVDTCGCCGKTGLKRTVVIRQDNGDLDFFGTTCAAEALKLSAKDVTAQARKAEAAKQRAADQARAKQAEAEFAEWVSFLRTATGMGGHDVGAMVTALGGFAPARAAFLARGKS